MAAELNTLDYFFDIIDKYNFSILIEYTKHGFWRIDIFWPQMCKRGGDMQLAHAEELTKLDAMIKCGEQIKKWIEDHKEELENYEANRNM